MKARVFKTLLGAALLGILLWPAALSFTLQALFPGENEWLFPRASMLKLLFDHLLLSLSAGAIASLVGISLAVLSTRRRGRAFLPIVRDTVSLAQTFPPAAVLALAIPFLGFGFKPALLALVLYSILPVLNNTITGLENLSTPVLEAARGMGMSRNQVLFHVELPLAMPMIGTGVRTSIVINVGTATLGALVGAGGLGSPIVAGLIRDNAAWVFQGALASALLALSLNGILQFAEKHLIASGR